MIQVLFGRWDGLCAPGVHGDPFLVRAQEKNGARGNNLDESMIAAGAGAL
jgi:hypothetical protein